MLNKLSLIFSKVDSSNFKKLYSNLDCLSITASSSYTTADDIVNSLFVIAFDKKPSTHYTLTKNINKLASVSKPLTILQKFLLFKKVMSFVNFKIEKEANVPDFVNFSNYVEKVASAPSSVDGYIDTKIFGKVAVSGNDMFIINPISEKVTPLKIKNNGLELISADINFSKLHELLGNLKSQDLITLNDVDGILTATGSPETINDLEHKVKDLGYYCESVNEETGVEGEIKNYSLRIFTDKVASKNDFDKKAEPEKLFGEDNKTANVIWENEGAILTLTTFPDYSVYQGLAKTTDGKKIPLFKQKVIKNQDGYALKEIEWFDENGNLEGNDVKLPVSEEDATELLNAVQKDYETRNSDFEQNLEDLKIKNIDTTNTNLNKDNNTFSEHLTDAEQAMLDEFTKLAKNQKVEVYANGSFIGIIGENGLEESEDTYNVKQETDGQKEVETIEDKFFEAKEEKPESFSASDLSENLAYIKQNSPESYAEVKEFLKQNLVGEDQKAYEFVETLESTNFKFTEATEKSNLYEDGHSQYQDLLQNKVLPLLEELPAYQDALSNRVDPEDVK